jgi:hypothetical protein
LAARPDRALLKLPAESLPRFGLGLVVLAVIVAAVLQVRVLTSRSHVDEARNALKNFSEALLEYRRHHGQLPGDMNRDGEIDAGETAYVATHLVRAGLIRSGADDLTAMVAGRPVTLRVIAAHASAVPNPPRGRNVIEMWNLPCEVAQELDSRIDDGHLLKGNLRASVNACTIGGANDPVPVVAFPFQSQE